MSSPAYHKASRWTAQWLAIVLFGVAAEIAVLIQLQRTGKLNALGPWSFLVGALPFLAAIAFGVARATRLDRERVQRVQRRLEQMGFAMIPRPDSNVKTACAVPVDMLRLRTGTGGLRWVALQADTPSPALIFEHEFVTGADKTIEAHHHTAIVWPKGHPDIANPGLTARPWFTLGSFPPFEREGLRELEIRDPAFSDLVRVWSPTGEAMTGQEFLTYPVRQLLRRAPLGEVWYVGAGWVMCVFKGMLDAANMRRFVTHARAVVVATK